MNWLRNRTVAMTLGVVVAGALALPVAYDVVAGRSLTAGAVLAAAAVLVVLVAAAAWSRRG